MTPEEFKWEILADVVEEDYQMLWEPLGWARTQLPDWPDHDRQTLAERTLRELLDGDLVYFFRVGAEPVNAAGENPDRRLSREHVEAALATEDWRTMPVGAEGTSVWFGPTAEGEEVLADPPPHIRRYFENRYG